MSGARTLAGAARVGPLVAAGGAAAIVLWGLRRHLLVVTVSGGSMRPAYQDGERLLALRRPGARVRAGRVVVAESPDRETLTWQERDAAGSPALLIKRVAATAGEPVPPEVAGGHARVPAGRVVLLGDNAAASFDSRQAGCFPADRVVAVVIGRLGGHRASGDGSGTPRKEGDRRWSS
ncbi:S26 family signal peptidase [Nonomuraea diastatica]|uniref:S26 family signal peptidase n=1 Tax=Nonomuraea diastatica TaxID=1848329 RepID=A0A4R4X0K5_9ACTN|nr:S26 family signal peptidase [Nonomuraea diastatica]TDD23660.1 S26 family signal peptidase [Nonomuraea diastatica]